MKNEHEKLSIPIWKKITITPKEASAYTGIGLNKIYDLIQYNTDIILQIGNKKMIKRELFEKFLLEQKYI